MGNSLRFLIFCATIVIGVYFLTLLKPNTSSTAQTSKSTRTQSQEPIRDGRSLGDQLKEHEAKLENEAKEARLAKAQEPILPPAWRTVGPQTMLSYDPDPFITKIAYNRLQIKAMQNITWARVATSDGRCDATFKLTPSGVRKMVNDYTLADEAVGATRMSELRAVYTAYYDIQSNQERFCKFTLERFGPTSKYEHLVDLK
jgi:hypothetical protein